MILMHTILSSVAIADLAAALGTPTHESAISARAAPFVPGGKKAGSAGGNAVPFWKEHLGWWYDWTPKPSSVPGVVSVPMLWGSGHHGTQDSNRFSEFGKMKGTPQYLLGFNEPDCSGEDTSANIGVAEGVDLWNRLIAPKGQQGALLGSPAMCMQKDEKWLKKFNNAGLSKSWDFTAIHIYKPDMAGVQADIDHYWNTYGKPIWVTEFGCVYDQNGFTPCSDQGQINKWINDVVDLGKAWLPTTNGGKKLSESDRTYLSAISKYH
ncbi:glycoside superfamily [Fusarium sporotrichioides]|uniref:Glycoside superfamily n=1 Tax=Fusarium sporotrichioides TaxID=5514 RepID=A0A395S9F2_FUSSP|nr:glycoside superfamily [Fusarium sporotrichioides]